MFKFQNPKQKTFQGKSLLLAGPERVRDQWESVLDDEQDQEAPVKLRSLFISPPFVSGFVMFTMSRRLVVQTIKAAG